MLKVLVVSLSLLDRVKVAVASISTPQSAESHYVHLAQQVRSALARVRHQFLVPRRLFPTGLLLQLIALPQLPAALDQVLLSMAFALILLQ